MYSLGFTLDAKFQFKVSSNKNDHFTISHDWENPCDTAQRTVKSNFFDKIIDQF